jgi:uncharacterized protein YbjT (DUF2867 family)
MKAFIAGATEVLDRRLVRRLSEHGHEVRGPVRDREAEQTV